MTLEELRVLISAEVAPLQQGIKKATSSLNGLQKTADKLDSKLTNVFQNIGSKLLKALSLAGIIKAFTSITKSALETASDLEEWENVVSVAFGSATEDIDDWSKTLANKFGLVELQAKEMSSTFMAMGNAQGIATQKGIIMSKNLTQLAGDMASFFNITNAEDVAEDLQSVYTGTVMPLRKYGIVLTEASLNQFALQKNIGKTVNEMNEAEKATLRYNYVMETMSGIQGDFAKTSSSWSNQIRILQTSWSQLMAIVGSALKQVLAPAIAMLNNLVSALIRVASAIASLFGVKVQAATSGVSSGVESIGDSLDSATGSAKKLKTQLASFDELDILKEDNDSGSALSDLGSGGFDVGDLYDVEGAKELDGITLLNNKLTELNQKLKDNYDKMVQYASEWGKKFSDAFMRINWGTIGATLANGLDIITGSVNAFIDSLNLDGFGRKISDMFNNFFSELNAEELGKNLGNKLYVITETLYGFFDNLDWKLIAQKIEQTFQSMFNRINWEKLGETFAKGLNGVSTMIQEWSENFPIRDFINNIWTAIKTFFEKVDWAELGEAIKKLITQAFDALKDIDYKEITSKLKECLDKIDVVQVMTDYYATKTDIIAEMWAGILGLPEGLVKIGVVGSDVFGALFSGVSKLVGSLPNLIVQITGINTLLMKIPAVAKWVEGFSGTISPITAAVKALGATISKFFSSIGLGSVATALGKALTAVKSFISSFGGGILTVITGAITAVRNFVVMFQNGWSLIREILKDLGIAITAVGAVLLGAPAAIAAAVAAAVAVLSSLVVVVKEHWTEIKDWISQQWTAFTSKVKEVWEGLKSWFSGFWAGLSDMFCDFLGINKVNAETETGETVEAQKTWWTSFKDWLSNLWQTITDKIKEIWTAIKNWLINLVKSLKDGVINGFTSLKSGLTTALSNIKNAFSTAWSNIVENTKSKFSTLVSNVGGAVSKIGSHVSSMLSTVSSGISSAWGSITSFVSSAVSKISSVRIPHLAGGAVLNKPTVAMMGEYSGARTNPEIVSPESKLREIYNEGNQETIALLDQMVGILSDIYDKDTSITIGDDTISAAAARGNRNYKMRTGRSQFAV